MIGLDDVVEAGLLLILPAFLQGGEVLLDGVEVGGIGARNSRVAPVASMSCAVSGEG